MSGTQDFVASITLAKESWDIVVRVVCLWFVPDNYANQKFFAMKMVLMDEKVCFWLYDFLLTLYTIFFLSNLNLIDFFFTGWQDSSNS